MNIINVMAAKLDRRSQRERVMLALVMIALLAAVSDGLFYSKLLAGRKQDHADSGAIAQRLAGSKKSVAAFQARLAQDPNALERIKLQRYESEIAQQDATLKEKTGAMVAPRQMTDVLKSMMERQQGLELISLRLLGAKPLLVGKPESVVTQDAPKSEVAPESGADVGRVNIFRHTVEMRFQGSYFAVLAYLRKLEDSGWRFEWDALDIRLDRYPVTRVTLRISTLSMTEGWIGV